MARDYGKGLWQGIMAGDYGKGLWARDYGQGIMGKGLWARAAGTGWKPVGRPGCNRDNGKGRTLSRESALSRFVNTMPRIFAAQAAQAKD
jgi:hypothetical protein